MKDLCKFIVVFLGIITALSILTEKKKIKINNNKSQIPKYYLTKGKNIKGSSIVKKKFIKNLIKKNSNNKSSNQVKPENDVPFLINKKSTYKNISNNIVNFSSSPSPSPQ